MFEESPNVAKVWSVKADGLISEWNEAHCYAHFLSCASLIEANPTKKVYRGCMVLEINGESVGSMSDEDSGKTPAAHAKAKAQNCHVAHSLWCAKVLLRVNST
eukprot:4181834-Amphidinium_carterae.1